MAYDPEENAWKVSFTSILNIFHLSAVSMFWYPCSWMFARQDRYDHYVIRLTISIYQKEQNLNVAKQQFSGPFVFPWLHHESIPWWNESILANAIFAVCAFVGPSVHHWRVEKWIFRELLKGSAEISIKNLSLSQAFLIFDPNLNLLLFHYCSRTYLFMCISDCMWCSKRNTDRTIQ